MVLKKNAVQQSRLSLFAAKFRHPRQKEEEGAERDRTEDEGGGEDDADDASALELALQQEEHIPKTVRSSEDATTNRFQKSALKATKSAANPTSTMRPRSLSPTPVSKPKQQQNPSTTPLVKSNVGAIDRALLIPGDEKAIPFQLPSPIETRGEEEEAKVLNSKDNESVRDSVPKSTSPNSTSPMQKNPPALDIPIKKATSQSPPSPIVQKPEGTSKLQQQKQDININTNNKPSSPPNSPSSPKRIWSDDTTASPTSGVGWIRSFHKSTTDSRDAAASKSTRTPAARQFRITTSLLTGLVSADKSKQHRSFPSNNIKDDPLVIGYVRLLSTSTTTMVTGSPDLIQSLPLSSPAIDGINNNTNTKAGSSFVVWNSNTNEPNTAGGVLLAETRKPLISPSSPPNHRDPSIALEVGILSEAGKPIPLGTVTFQPGMVEVRDRRRHLRVEKVRDFNGKNSRLFRKKQPSRCDYKLSSRESFLSIKLDVEHVVQQEQPSPSNYTNKEKNVVLPSRQRSMSVPQGVETPFFLQSLDTQENIVTSKNNEPMVASTTGFGYLMAAGCCGGVVAGSTVVDRANDRLENTITGEDDETIDSETTGRVTNNSTFQSQPQTSSQPMCDCFGSSAEVEPREQMGAISNIVSDGEITFDERSMDQSAQVRRNSQNAWPSLFSIFGFGASTTHEINAISGDENEEIAEPRSTATTAFADATSVATASVIAPSGFAACFGDADVEGLTHRGTRSQAAQAPAMIVATATDLLPPPKSFCSVWCGEEDVNGIQPIISNKPGTYENRSTVPTSQGSACSGLGVMVKDASPEAIQSINNEESASFHSRHESHEGYRSEHSTEGFTSYTTSYSGTLYSKQAENVGCFPFITGIGDEDDASASASCDSSTTDGFSLAAETRFFPQDNTLSGEGDTLAEALNATQPEIAGSQSNIIPELSAGHNTM